MQPVLKSCKCVNVNINILCYNTLHYTIVQYNINIRQLLGNVLKGFDKGEAWLVEMSANLKRASHVDEILNHSKANPEELNVLNFWASWIDSCIQMNQVVEALAGAHPTASFWDVSLLFFTLLKHII